MLNDDEVKKYLIEHKNKYNQKIFVKYISEDIKKYLNNRYKDSECIKESIHRLLNNIEVRPTCKICGGYVHYSPKMQSKFRDCCSLECTHKLIQKHVKETCLKKYGVDNPAKTPENIQKRKEYYKNNNIKEKLHNVVKNKYGVDNVFQLQEVKEKIKNTSLKKYGTEYPSQSQIVKNKIKKTNNINFGCDYGVQSKIIKEKIKQTCINKYGVDNPAKSEVIKEKIKQTDLKKYGVEYHIISPEIKQKIRETNLEKYGVENIFANKEIREKIKQTNLQKYNKEYYMQTEEFINKISKLLKEKYINSYDEIMQKRINTNLQKYNTEYYSQTELFRKNMSILMSSPQMREQIYLTHKKNNSFKQSKEEINLFTLLKEKYPDTINQYKSELYPFNCDFYIPNLNLYIEYNGTWTHGGHPFNSNNIEDIKIINKWKEKNTKYYDNAIYVWTILDITKRNVALKNNLNYVELWNYKEAIKYIENL